MSSSNPKRRRCSWYASIAVTRWRALPHRRPPACPACARSSTSRIMALFSLARMSDAPRMLDIIERERVNVLIGVPTMFVALVEAQQARRRDTSSVTSAAAGGAMVPAELIRQVRELLGWDLLPVYGQTESSPLLTQVRPGDPEAVRSTVGQALPQTEISIRDPGTNAVAELGTVGEICTRGYAVTIGYNANPPATAAAMASYVWLHSGDLGT